MNYTELFQHLGIQAIQSGHHHCRPGWLQMDCPACGPDTGKYHLGFHKTRGYFHCWVCGALPLVPTLQALSGQSPSLILALLREAAPAGPIEPRTPHSGRLSLPKGLCALQPAHRSYLQSRGFDPDEIASLWGVKGIGIAAKLSWRLFIPVTYRHETVSWTTRAIGETNSRYISASQEEEKVNHKSLLYGADMAMHSVVVVEGPTDAWTIGPGTVAVLGLTVTQEQVERIKAYPIRAICFDSSPEAQRRGRKLADQLSLFPGETHVVQMTGKDPATAPKSEVKALRKRFLD